MGLKTERKTIGEHEYIVTQLDAVKGSRVFTRLTKILAPALAPLAGIKGSDSADDVMGQTIGKALSTLAENIDEEDFDYFREVFAQSTELVVHDQGKVRTPKLATVFALHFAGNYGEMLEWLFFCLEVNFGSFFDQIGLHRAVSRAAATEASK